MAEIYGVSVKNIRCNEDHEGCAMYSADVWYNKKKLGHWSQSYWCGPDEYDFDESILKDAVEKYRKSDHVEDIYRSVVDADILIDGVIRLSEDEKRFKMGLKKGHKSFTVQEHGFREGFWYGSDDKDKIKQLREYEKLTQGGERVSIYTSLDDFVIL